MPWLAGAIEHGSAGKVLPAQASSKEPVAEVVLLFIRVTEDLSLVLSSSARCGG